MEMKKIQQAGGTCQGEYNPTWLKQPGDNLTLIFGAGLVGYWKGQEGVDRDSLTEDRMAFLMRVEDIGL
eukprot:scaffold2445_cov205-Alexandrium_tamarense.AAC.18